jgi:hypothetical protein
MRRIVSYGLMGLFLTLLAPPIQAQQNVTGDWVLTYMAQGREGEAVERTMEFTFVQDGSTVTGTTVFAPMGRRPGGGAGQNPPPPQEIEIQEGKIEGDQLTFTVVRTMRQRSTTQVFTATVSGNSMEGTIETTGGMRGSGETAFTGTKKES